ncbi:MAG: hypothetical protein Kow0031_06850 [Anaerolineae bacterium]
MLGELAVFHLHFAFAAGEPAAADALYFHAHLAGGIQQRLAGFDPAPPPGGHKHDQRIIWLG